jgi:hypothetical protein
MKHDPYFKYLAAIIALGVLVALLDPAPPPAAPTDGGGRGAGRPLSAGGGFSAIAPRAAGPHVGRLSMAGPPPQPSHPWRWIPTLYFAQGIPYVVVMTLSVVMYKNLKVSNTDIALYTSWLYLPWVIKPLWSPLVDLFRTKRWWIVSLQFVIGVALA